MIGFYSIYKGTKKKYYNLSLAEKINLYINTYIVMI